MAAPGRRKFIQSSLTLSALPLLGLMTMPASHRVNPVNNRFKISLNAYSFNTPLRSGKTSLESVMEFCAEEGFDAVDLTGYYFPGYPKPPSDEYIFELKKKAHHLGLAISGTGIRNEFAQQDKAARGGEVTLVKKWIEVAAKLGAPVIRIFTKRSLPEGLS